jgi:hypothetical protein
MDYLFVKYLVYDNFNNVYIRIDLTISQRMFQFQQDIIHETYCKTTTFYYLKEDIVIHIYDSTQLTDFEFKYWDDQSKYKHSLITKSGLNRIQTYNDAEQRLLRSRVRDSGTRYNGTNPVYI